MIMNKKMSPCIVFAFGKRLCETFAQGLSKLDLTSDDEKARIKLIFTNAVDTLSEDDRQLPQIDHLEVGDQVGKVDGHGEDAVGRANEDLEEGTLDDLADEGRLLLDRLLMDLCPSHAADEGAQDHAVHRTQRADVRDDGPLRAERRSRAGL